MHANLRARDLSGVPSMFVPKEVRPVSSGVRTRASDYLNAKRRASNPGILPGCNFCPAITLRRLARYGQIDRTSTGQVAWHCSSFPAWLPPNAMKETGSMLSRKDGCAASAPFPDGRRCTDYASLCGESEGVQRIHAPVVRRRPVPRQSRAAMADARRPSRIWRLHGSPFTTRLATRTPKPTTEGPECASSHRSGFRLCGNLVGL